MSNLDLDAINMGLRARQDQDRAEIADMAGDIGLFHRELYQSLVGEDYFTAETAEMVRSLTQAFAAMVVFSGCSCEVGG